MSDCIITQRFGGEKLEVKRPTGILGLIFKQLLLGLRVLWDPGSQGGIA